MNMKVPSMHGRGSGGGAKKILHSKINHRDGRAPGRLRLYLCGPHVPHVFLTCDSYLRVGGVDAPDRALGGHELLAAGPLDVWQEALGQRRADDDVKLARVDQHRHLGGEDLL